MTAVSHLIRCGTATTPAPSRPRTARRRVTTTTTTTTTRSRCLAPLPPNIRAATAVASSFAGAGAGVGSTTAAGRTAVLVLGCDAEDLRATCLAVETAVGNLNLAVTPTVVSLLHRDGDGLTRGGEELALTQGPWPGCYELPMGTGQDDVPYYYIVVPCLIHPSTFHFLELQNVHPRSVSRSTFI